jgi:hypothetical protein
VNLQGEILDLYFHNSDVVIPLQRMFVLLKVRIVNHGPEEATVTHCGLRVSLKDFRAAGEIYPYPETWRIKRRKEGPYMVPVYEEISVEPRLGANPHAEIYRKGIPREGWVAFELYNSHDRQFPNAQFDLLLRDSLGGEHCIRRDPQVYVKRGELLITPSPSPK